MSNIYIPNRFQQHNEQTDSATGERIWVEREGILGDSGDYGYLHTRPNRTINNEENRVFLWRDPTNGIDVPIRSFPDRPIPNLTCPDCGCPACETDQIGVALCTGTPGWYFYYRQVTDGYGKPKSTYKIVNGEMQLVTEYEVTKIERQPDGEFKEKKEDE